MAHDGYPTSPFITRRIQSHFPWNLPPKMKKGWQRELFTRERAHNASTGAWPGLNIRATRNVYIYL